MDLYTQLIFGFVLTPRKEDTTQSCTPTQPRQLAPLISSEPLKCDSFSNPFFLRFLVLIYLFFSFSVGLQRIRNPHRKGQTTFLRRTKQSTVRGDGNVWPRWCSHF